MKNLSIQISLGIVLTIFSVINAAIPQPEGALISATFTSTVGVMLDETPVEGGFRTRVAEYYLNQPIEFWEGKAFEQSRYTTFRQIFRSSYQEGKRQLTLPPYEVWKYTFDPAGPRRTQIEGHDYVAYDYTFYSVVVTSAESVVASEPDLEQIGGKWSDTWFLPADTDLLFQRTGYACVDEYAFPKDSADSENIWVYYDDQCVAEEPQVEYDAYEVRCHYTAYPNESCVEALTNHVGTSMVEITWERIPYTNEEAAKWRVGQLTSDGADMAVIGEHGFMAGSTQNRLEYKYIDKDSCTLSEGGKNDDGCVGGPGWRRLLKFSSSSINIGKTDIIIGDAPSSQLTNSTLYQLGVYEFDECHQHAHFQHYGDFYYGETPGRKVGFCLQTTWRYFNNEYTKLNSPFDTCQYQGISTGWGDDYIAGLDCQWIDVTDSPAGTDQLGEVFNPDGFLCEGTPILDPQTGGPLWLETEFRNDKGDVVHRAACDFTPNYMENNIDHVPVTLPTHGSRVTQSCKGGDLGLLRDCGFSIQKQTVECTPGSKVYLELSNESPETPQVVRICEASRVLGSIACVEQQSLVNAVVMSGKTKVSFTCPVARDYAPETGGLYTILTAPFLESDPRQHVDVVVVGKHNNNDDSDCMPGDTILNFNFAGLISTKN